MASGLLGKAALGAATNSSVYTAPGGISFATVNISVVNTGLSTSNVRLSIGSAAPAASDYIEYDFPLAVGAVMERTGLVMSPAEIVVAQGSVAGVVVRVHGFEK
jgi:hypothetical protein